jgi:outer membrane protein TolC
MALTSALEVVREARCLEREGIINKAERLAAEVEAAEVATRLAGAHTRLTVARAELSALLGVDSLYLLTTTPLLDITPLPSQDFFLQAIGNNPIVRATHIEKQLANEKLHIEQGRYLPDIALIGGHRLWSKGIDKGLIPRTFVGIGASWTLFDGTERERSIAKSRSQVRTSQLAEEQHQQELRVAVERLWGTLSESQNQLATANTTIALAEELVRMRHRAFSEGMATASEVIRSEVRLAEAKLGRIATIYQWNIARVELLTLCGLPLTENIQQQNKRDYEDK